MAGGPAGVNEQGMMQGFQSAHSNVRPDHHHHHHHHLLLNMMQLDTDDTSRSDALSPSSPRSELPDSLNFHPDFSSPDATIVLAAKESKMYFRIHHFTLKSTSGFFREMYSLPQCVLCPATFTYS